MGLCPISRRQASNHHKYSPCQASKVQWCHTWWFRPTPIIQTWCHIAERLSDNPSPCISDDETDNLLPHSIDFDLCCTPAFVRGDCKSAGIMGQDGLHIHFVRLLPSPLTIVVILILLSATMYPILILGQAILWAILRTQAPPPHGDRIGYSRLSRLTHFRSDTWLPNIINPSSWLMTLRSRVQLFKILNIRSPASSCRTFPKSLHGRHGARIILSSVYTRLYLLLSVVTWIGNNDVFREQYDINSQIAIVFRLQEQLYNVGARNFFFINVVPFDRSPSGHFPQTWLLMIEVNSDVSTLQSRISQWNSAFPDYSKQFAANHSDISVALYDVHSLFNTVLDDPSKYGFVDAISSCQNSTCIWADGVHSTFAMHNIIADDMNQFFKSPTISNYSSGAAIAKHSIRAALVAFGVFLCIV